MLGWFKCSYLKKTYPPNYPQGILDPKQKFENHYTCLFIIETPKERRCSWCCFPISIASSSKTQPISWTNGASAKKGAGLYGSRALGRGMLGSKVSAKAFHKDGNLEIPIRNMGIKRLDFLFLVRNIPKMLGSWWKKLLGIASLTVVTCQRIRYSYHKGKNMNKNHLVFLSPHLLLHNGSTNLIVKKKLGQVIYESRHQWRGKFFKSNVRNPATGESKLPEISRRLDTTGPKVGTSVQQFMAVPVAPAAKPDSTSFSDESFSKTGRGTQTLEDEIPWHKHRHVIER